MGTELAVDVGPNPRLPGYGLFTYRIVGDLGDEYYLPWMPVQQLQLVIPRQRRYRDELEPVVFSYPGYTLSVSELDLGELEVFGN